MNTTPPHLPSIDETARRQFEAAWRDGRPEALDAFLPPPSDPRHLATLEELIHIELEFAWKARGPQLTTVTDQPTGHTPIRRAPVVEDYLARFPQLNDPAILARLVRQEYLVRCRYGDQPSTGEYRGRFPD